MLVFFAFSLVFYSCFWDIALVVLMLHLLTWDNSTDNAYRNENPCGTDGSGWLFLTVDNHGPSESI